MNAKMKSEILSALNAMRHIYKGLALGGWVTTDKRDLMTGVENLTSLIVRVEQLNEKENDLPMCCLCDEQMLPNVKYQVFGFISQRIYAHTKCDHPQDIVISPFNPWMWNEINGERVE